MKSKKEYYFQRAGVGNDQPARPNGDGWAIHSFNTDGFLWEREAPADTKDLENLKVPAGGSERDPVTGPPMDGDFILSAVTTTLPLCVARFAHRMAKKLEANRHKGDWRAASWSILDRRLLEELDEFRAETRKTWVDPELMAWEAADVANLLMFHLTKAAN